MRVAPTRARAALSDISKHTPELAQSVVDAGAVAYLAPLVVSHDGKLKRQVCAALGHRDRAQCVHRRQQCLGVLLAVSLTQCHLRLHSGMPPAALHDDGGESFLELLLPQVGGIAQAEQDEHSVPQRAHPRKHAIIGRCRVSCLNVSRAAPQEIRQLTYVRQCF